MVEQNCLIKHFKWEELLKTSVSEYKYEGKS